MLQPSVKSTRMVRVFCPDSASEGVKERVNYFCWAAGRKDKRVSCNNTKQRAPAPLWRTDLFGNHPELIVRSADQNNIQASLCQLQGNMQTERLCSWDQNLLVDPEALKFIDSPHWHKLYRCQMWHQSQLHKGQTTDEQIMTEDHLENNIFWSTEIWKSAKFCRSSANIEAHYNNFIKSHQKVHLLNSFSAKIEKTEVNSWAKSLKS